jgi:GxxExxY protein
LRRDGRYSRQTSEDWEPPTLKQGASGGTKKNEEEEQIFRSSILIYHVKYMYSKCSPKRITMQPIPPRRNIVEPLLFRDESYKIIGAAIAVHSQLGSGFLESVYQEALEYELRKRQIPFKSQASLPVYYSGQLLEKSFIADFVCYNEIIVEIKALDRLTNREYAQVINYLKASKLRLGYLLNFGSDPPLERERIVRLYN